MRPAKLGRFRAHRLPFRPLLWNAFRPCTGAAPLYSDTTSDTDTIETSLFDTLSEERPGNDFADSENVIPGDGVEASTTSSITENTVCENDIISPHNRVVSARTVAVQTEYPLEHFTSEPAVLTTQNTRGSPRVVAGGAASTGEEPSGCISRLDLCFNCRRAIHCDDENDPVNNRSTTRGGSTENNVRKQLVPGVGADGVCDANFNMNRSPSNSSLYQCARCNKRFVNGNPSPSLPLTFLYNSNDSRNASWSSRNGSVNSRLFGSLPFRSHSRHSSSSNSLASWTSNINDGYMNNASLLSSDSAQGAVGPTPIDSSTSFNGLLFNFARQFQHTTNSTRWGVTGINTTQSNSSQSSNSNSRDNSIRNNSMEEMRRLLNNPHSGEQRHWYFYDPRLTQFNRAQRLTLETDFAGIHNEISMPGIIAPPSYDEIQTIPTLQSGVNWPSEAPGVYPEEDPPPPYSDDPPPSYYSRSNSVRSSSGISRADSDTGSDADNASIISDIILENWAMLPQADDIADSTNEVIQSLLNELQSDSPPNTTLDTTEDTNVSLQNIHHQNGEESGASLEPANVSSIQAEYETHTDEQANTNSINNEETDSLISRDSVQSNLMLQNERTNCGWPGISGVTAMDPDQFHFGPTFRMGMRPPIRWNRSRDVNRWTSAQGWLPQI